MEMIEIGTHENGKFYGDYTEQGYIFKDENAYRNNRDEICYISEAGFAEVVFNEGMTDKEAFAEIEKGGADTHNSLFKMVKEAIEDECPSMACETELIENICDYIFYTCDWQCFSTLLYETDIREDIVYYIIGKAQKRDDWNDEWNECCLYDFLDERLESGKSYDDLIDEFVNLPNE